MINIFLKKDKQEEGFAVLLSVLVLASITGLVISVFNVSFRITKSNQSIINSEKAFFAAETAAEITIYDIVKNNRGLDLPDLVGQALGGNPGATWGRRVSLATLTPGLCSAPQPKPVCSDADGSISTTNDLSITLEDGESFQLDMDIVDPGNPSNYPANVRILGVTAGSRVIVSGNGQQEVKTSQTFIVPETDVIDPNLDYRFRIINESGSQQTYTITPLGSSVDFPLGLNISTVGIYQGTERRVDVTNPAWLIF